MNLPNLTMGIDNTKFISASQSFTPVWIEYNEKRLYNLEVIKEGLQVQNGIRYFNGKICVNDVFKYWDIDKTIQIGEYQGLNFIEVK